MSLAARALAAIALTVVFYVLAVGIAAGLIAVPILRVEAGESPGLTGLFMPVVALCILVSLVPRRIRFEPPGPPVTPETQPELLDLVADVAGAVGHPMPDATYLEADVNAAVLETGRLTRCRVLILGLPLLEVLTVEQLRAVLAHEFGHYVAGDTRVGRVTYRTRETVLRTVASLYWSDDGDDGWFLKLVRAPFEWYARMFLRMTSAISRTQEFAADALAARVAGSDAQIGALRRAAACAPAFEAYWDDEVVPALMRGLRPPLGEGFRTFLSTARIDAAVGELLSSALEQDAHDPYDSHPTLRQRLEALAAGPRAEPPPSGSPASTLLRGHAELELGLLRALAGEDADALRPVSWDEVERDWLQALAETAAEHHALFDGRRVGDVPALAADPTPLVAVLRAMWPDEYADDDAARDAVPGLLAAALTVALVREGFTFDARLGGPISCTRGEHRFTPLSEIAEIAAVDEGARLLSDRLLAAGVHDAPLAPTPGEPADAQPGATAPTTSPARN
jgi:heat shock protein HtpX